MVCTFMGTWKWGGGPSYPDDFLSPQIAWHPLILSEQEVVSVARLDRAVG